MRPLMKSTSFFLNRGGIGNSTRLPSPRMGQIARTRVPRWAVATYAPPGLSEPRECWDGGSPRFAEARLGVRGDRPRGEPGARNLAHSRRRQARAVPDGTR